MPEVSNPVFARLFDRFAAKDKGRGEDELRRELVSGLSGRVVEVGPGNGINFEHYPATIVDGTAAALPLDADSADALVVAGVLCSVPDQHAALAEFHRVLRPEGELRFYEHVRSRRPAFARYQDAVALLWPRLMGGCQPHRNTLAAIERAGFRIQRCRGFGFPANARAYPVAPRILGVARVAPERANA
jgi:ubiquinone/menaquinone biosynthesis C-methylase UbiE